MILDEIIANKRIEVAERQRQTPLAELRARAQAALLARDFGRALVGDHVALICEIKRMSPSKGELNVEPDLTRRAQAYASSGAAAISVLTDYKFFGGSLDDLDAVRAVVHIPVLRKDFIVDEYQVFESRASQADALLLIVRALSDAQLRDYLTLTHALGMAALVEVHDEAELERALAADARIIGINNRNLADFSVDLATTERLAPRIPAGHVIVAESGAFRRRDVERVGRAGAHAVLVGEALMRAPDIGAKVRELTSVTRGV